MTRWWLLGLMLLAAPPALAEGEAPAARSYVAVIIDDLGDSLRDGEPYAEVLKEIDFRVSDPLMSMMLGSTDGILVH